MQGAIETSTGDISPFFFCTQREANGRYHFLEDYGFGV